MKKIIDTFAILFIAIVLPLLFKPQLLLTFPILIVFSAGVFLGLTQPTLSKDKEQLNKDDKFSMIAIVISVILCLAISVVEYAYFLEQLINLQKTRTLIGLGLIIFGFGFRYYSIRVLGKFFSAEVKIRDDHELVQMGPYKYLRHPSYLGAWLGILGVGMFLNSNFGILACLFIYFPAYIYRITCEEKALVFKFPTNYPQYQKQTWKMFPYLF